MRSLAEIVSLRTGPCRDAASALPAIAAGELDEKSAGPDHAAGLDHVSQCLRCQAEVAAYRRLLAALKALRHEIVVAPDGSIDEVIEALSGQAPAPWVVRAAYVGGITVATAAAGAAGVLVWMSRRRAPLASAS